MMKMEFFLDYEFKVYCLLKKKKTLSKLRTIISFAKNNINLNNFVFYIKSLVLRFQVYGI
jgi:hypothetical protein